MPKVYRVMVEEDGQPKLGLGSRCLGVRVPQDIQSPGGNVIPETGGMSVAPSLQALPPGLVPKRLRHLYEGAIGPDSGAVWSHGNGPFARRRLTPRLVLRPDRPGHGLVEPDAPMPLEIYQAALAGTRVGWCKDEV